MQSLEADDSGYLSRDEIVGWIKVKGRSGTLPVIEENSARSVIAPELLESRANSTMIEYGKG